MKNLSLVSMQATPTKVSDSAAKADARTDMSAAVTTKPSFKAALNNQIQSRQNQAKQANNKPLQEDKKILMPVKGNQQPKNDSASVADEKAADAASKAVELNSQLPVDLAVQANEAAVTLQASQDVNTQPVSADVVAAMLVAAMPVAANKGFVTQSSVDEPALDGRDVKLASTDTTPIITVDSGLVKTVGVDSRNVASMPVSDKPQLDEQTMAEHTRWLDAVLPNAGKQNTGLSRGSELASDLAALSTKEKTTTEILAPANFQSTMQANAASVMQQAASGNNISAYPGKAGWDQALSQKVVWMVGAGEQSATLTLNPPDLGPLQVVIHVHNDQADTTFISDNADVRQALEDGISNLRNKMSESGVQLGQTNVSTSGQSQNGFQQTAQNQTRSIGTINDVDATSDVVGGRSQTYTRTSNGLVDTFA